MKSLKYLLLSSLVLAACSDKSANQVGVVDTQSNSSIIGGSEVKAGDREMVSTVGLYDKAGKFLCTGTLISGNLVLTAAHCIGEDPTQMVVIFKDKFSNAKPEDMRPVIAAKRHDKYQPEQRLNTADIAVVRFNPGAGIPAGYNTAKVLRDFSLLSPGAKIIAVGYGLNWSWVITKGAGTLRTVELEVENPAFSETEISLQQSLKKGICSGDSGGPGYIDIGGQLYVWGVVSRGAALNIPLTPKCAMTSIYTRVDVYAPFIIDAAKALNALN
ncbi:S1 family peptidase [Bdellovibrio svalbardensis]|uniref:Trypsin-like serine protease n=1 Tax=Bdellovibrio svalbardensis TaxID=2972972 RepID=A0ABT6DK62_9BACT|nr:trypsin-like serine protease [Bdellovibrio svalbardensis]MDG0816304.1 trypsin-like serine protease [Bdellovibrio svalbardensis]